MPIRVRSLNRFAVALALIGAFVSARAGMQMFAAPTVTFNTLPDLNFNQGEAVTVAFAAQGFPTNVTYTAEGLPAGLSMSMGIDTLGHVVGILGGTLAADTPTASGSEGIYNVRIDSSDGAVSNFFKVDVSHWSAGDLFVGGGQWVYQVYREDGTFKTDVTIPDDPNTTFGSTTGCAVNWKTGEVWATNFDDVLPALNVITRHSGSNPLPYTDPSRRLSTERYGVGNVLTPFPGNENPFDENPESVAFNNNGDMLVGHSFGYFNDNGDVSAPDGTPTVLDDPIGGWVYVDAAGQPLVDIDGNMVPSSANISPAGFFEKWVPPFGPTNILSPTGQPIPVPLQGGMDMHRYIPDANGNYQTANRQFYDFHYGYTGIDTLDLLSDQTTMNYTSEDWYIYRYDLGTDKQMPVVGSNVLGESKPISTRPMYGLRALPPGDGSGGYLVVNEFHIDRLDATGHIVQSYDVREDPDYPANPDLGWAEGDVNGWFAIAIAPGGRTFWAATRQDVFHFDIASGAVIGSKIRATIGTLHTNAELAGLCVMDEYRAAQENCGPTGLGNGIDDDHDGTIDEGCFRVEVCSPFSPGDDDGDGLIDYNDPDCGATPAQQCVTGGPTDNSVAGVCERADYEGDTVVVPGIPPPCSLCDDWTFTYSATGLPNGLTMNPATGEVTGIPFFSIVNPNSETSAPVVFHVTVNSTWQKVGAPASSFSKTFDWTIYNRNRVPVAVDDGTPTVNAGSSFNFDVRANDSDIDGDTITINSFTQPAIGQGTVALVGQNLVYTAPASGFTGMTAFTYTVKDTYNPAGISNVATVTVKVNGVPVAVDDAYTTLEDTPLAATLVVNDTPSSDGGNVWSKTSNPANGVATVFQGGSFTYTPNPNFNGTDSFTYKICDINNDCSNATARITITPVNDLPIAVPDVFTTDWNTPVSGTLTGNDTPSGDGGNVWSRVTNGLFGNAVVNGDGTFTYTPNAGFFGVDTFTYKVCDVDNDCSVTTVTITIVRINALPVAVNDTFTTPEDTPVNSTVTGNDTLSTDGGNVFTKVTNPTHGTATVNPDGTFNYTPDPNYNGSDSFMYKLCDRDPDCVTATVTITITPVNDLPVAVNDAFSTSQNTAVSSTLKTNDTPSGDGGNVWSKVSNPGNGTATVNADGTFTYTPNTGFSGVDTFTYKLCDVDNDCSVATVTITIIRINALPVAVNDVFTTPEDTPLNATVTGNDTLSTDGGNVFTKVTNPTHGTATVNPDGTFNYTPDPNYNGSDVFLYKLCDRDPDCVTATVTITITPVNDVPVAVNDAFTTPEDTAVSGTLKTNDTPSGDGGNVWSKVTNPVHGNATVNADGTFTYTPAPNYNGTDSFTYKVCDVDNDCSIATVTITITPVNDVPVAVNDAFTTNQNTALNATVTANDTPSGDGGNVWAKVTNPAHGAVIMAAAGTFTYTPATGYAGMDSFTYNVCDVDNDCSTATVTIRINGVPVAVNDNYTTPKNTALTASVATNDTPSVDGGNVWTMTSAPASGTVVLNTNGTFTYTPSTNFTGTVSFNYKVCDVDNDCANAVATIRISDVPAAVNDSYTTNKNTPFTATVATNDTPSADGGNVWTVTVQPPSGTLVFGPTGGFTYSPAAGFTGTVTFTYKVCDVDNDCATAIATIKINDVPVAVNDSFTTSKNTALTATVVANDTLSADGGNVWTKTSNPLHGAAVMTATGGFTYTPSTGYTGADSFTYKICDVDNDCATATVTIRISDVPAAVNDSYTTNKNTPFTATVAGNDTPSADGGNVWTVTVQPASGTLVFGPTGGFTYSPATGFTGTVTFTYKVCDVDNDCATAIATIRINDVPAAVDDSFTTNKNTALTATVVANDTLSADGGNVWTKTSNPLHGAAVMTATGGFTYTPATGYTGADSFTYKICDVDNDCATATVTIRINDVPLAADDSYTTPKNTPFTGTVAGNDTPSADGGNVWTVTVQPASGTLVFGPTGAFTYSPAAGFTGTVTFTYKVCDVDNDCATAVATIKINDVPVAVNDSFTTNKNTALTATVVANDTQSADGGNVWTKLTSPAHGTATMTATGGFTYTPSAGYTGTDSFTYNICDVDNDCSTATVTIRINDAPAAVNDSYTTPKDTPFTATVASNDTPSADGGNVWAVTVQPASGTLVFGPTGAFTYSPAAGFTGTVTFTYKVCDVDNDCATAVATIKINDVPVAVNDTFSTMQDTPIAGSLTGNDTPSADGGNVWTKTSDPLHGTATVNADGTFLYTPAAGYYGSDSFTYKVCDVDNDCSTATVTITLVRPNHVPVAVDDIYSTTEDTPITSTVAGNDALSPDGGNVWTVTSTVTHGTLTLSANGAFTYTPAANYNGLDSFSYKLCDVDGDCSMATATITILPVNDVPLAANDVYTTAPNTAITKDAATNDTPSGDGGNIWTKTSNPSSGTVIFNADGTFTYTPVTNFSGVVNFSYKVCDVNNDCATATITITITPLVTGTVGRGDTATIGYWQNQNGQALIKKVNGSATATNLGNWLAASYPYLWGAHASATNNLTGKTNTQIAAYYITVFKSDKWTAQVLASALAGYVTSSALAGGNYSVAYGFNYSATGTGTKTYNVGSYGTAIGLVNNTSYTVSALLAQANLRKQLGTYDSNAFNVIFSGINVLGDIIK